MRVLHLIYDHMRNPWVGGGGAVRAYELNRRLAEAGHSVTVVSGNYPGARNYEEGSLRFKFKGSDRGYIASTFSYALSAARYIKRRSHGYDLVVEDFAPWNPVWACLLSERPTVLHMNHREKTNILRRWSALGIPFYMIEALYPHLYTHITALSEETKRKIGLERAMVIPAGISESTIAPGASPHRSDYVLYLGRIEAYNKGLDTLIDAMRHLQGIRLVIAGRGRDEQKLRKMAEGLNVEFRGFVSDDEKLRLMREAAFLAFPSRFEGWGIAVLEAAAAGLPSLVSSIPELEFATRDGFGIEFKVGDAKDLAIKIQYLMDNRTLREEMEKKALAGAKRHTWERVAEDYERYLRLVAAR